MLEEKQNTQEYKTNNNLRKKRKMDKLYSLNTTFTVNVTDYTTILKWKARQGAQDGRHHENN